MPKGVGMNTVFGKTKFRIGFAPLSQVVLHFRMNVHYFPFLDFTLLKKPISIMVEYRSIAFVFAS